MATPAPPPVEDPAAPSPENQLKTPETPATATPTLTLNPNTRDDEATATAPVPRPPESSSSNPPEEEFITIPSYSRWFSWDKIQECEKRFLPEFFDGRSHSKNPRVYKYYRDSIIRLFRANPSRKISFTYARKVIVGDVGSIRRVYDFLESWGLINYAAAPPSALLKPPPQLKWEERESKNGGGDSAFLESLQQPRRESSKKLCSGCKSLCSIACFVCDKFDLTLCARCYVRGNYRVGVTTSDFRRVEISEETKTSWTDKETLHLLEAIMHYGDDWKKVAEHVSGRNEKECVARFIKLPFGEQFLGPVGFEDVQKYYQIEDQSGNAIDSNGILSLPSEKRRRISPLADASNPIMAQAAFLSAMGGSKVAEVSAHAAVAAVYEDFNDDQKKSTYSKSNIVETEQNECECGVNGCGGLIQNCVSFSLREEMDSLIPKEVMFLLVQIRHMQLQMKEIQDKIVHFEEVELQIEKERHQLQHMKNLLFADQLALLFQRKSPAVVAKSRDDVRMTDTIA
ncbi:hypothetical protein Sjap_009656 [Stephania japonica]|uniref:SWI/SNF complex subunit SWI3B n=1 Tax=Stephania japonica TaxID=461633 RepID=A0AAP0J846_9MAGN